MSSGMSRRNVWIVGGLVWASCVGSALLGALVLMGWAWNLPLVKSVAPGLPVMTAYASLGTLLGGVALGFLHPVAPCARHRALGLACAAGMLLIGAASFLEQFSDWESGLVGQLFRWTEWAQRTPSPLPPASSTFCLVLLGGSLLLLGSPRLSAFTVWADALVVPALLLALLAFNGYLQSAVTLSCDTSQWPQRGMGLHTSVAILLLGMGRLCARPDQGLMARITQDTLGGFLARRLVPITLVGPLLFGVLLKVLESYGMLDASSKFHLFTTVSCAGGVALVLLSTSTVDRLDAERRCASAEAERERTLLRTVVDSAPVGILFVDAHTDEVRANSTFHSLVGLSLVPSAGRPQILGHLRHPDGRTVQVEDLPSSRALRGHVVPPEEYLVVHPDRLSPALASAAPVREASGAVSGAIVTLQDITVRRELEHLRENYVGLISHDLRNPLQVITLRASLLQRMLQEKQLGSEAGMANALLQNALRMSGMVEELLEGSRLETGQVELHREPTNLGAFLEKVLEQDILPDTRERFRLEVSGPLPPVWVDAPRVERVVVNLLTNALKYSPPGTPVVVRLERAETHVVVAIRDQGAGLSPEEAAHLFEKYYRTRDGRKADGVGLGLGLYISRLIIEAHGGRIAVESIPGQGSTFTFTLPLAAPERPPPEPAREAEGGSPSPGAP